MLRPAATDPATNRARTALAATLLTLALISLGACSTGSPSGVGGGLATGEPGDGEPVASELPAGEPGGDGTATDGTGGGEPVPTAPGGEELTVDGSGGGEATTDEPATGGATGTDPDGGSGTVVTVSGPIGCDAPAAEIQARALELFNAARAEARSCGTDRLAAAGALGWDSRLEAAARTHSADMAATGNFDHTGTDGSSPGDRIERQGYTWGTYAENIAAGQATLEAAVAGWLESPGHCRNVMKADVTDTAVACVSNDDARYRRYWTHVLSRPFERRARP